MSQYDRVTNRVAADYSNADAGAEITGPDIEVPGVLQALRDRLPSSEVVRRGNGWSHRKRDCLEPVGRGPSGSALLYIPVVNNPILFEAAVRSVPGNVDALVVDQSAGTFEPYVPSGITHIHPERMSFSQLQNFMLRRADSLGVRELLFMHSDASCDPSVITALLARARAEAADWGVIFTSYDTLCAYNVPKLMERAGFWDESFEWYLADSDYYHRVRRAGLLTIDTGLEVVHEKSGTTKTDSVERQWADSREQWSRGHYHQKWGGDPHEERFARPYDL